MDLLKQASGHWATRSFGAGVVSTVVDVGTLLAGVHLFRLGTVPSAALGVVLGSVVSFALNKYVAFRDAASPLAPQLGKYLATIVSAMIVHTSLMWLLCDKLHAPVLGAKLLADFLVFTCGCLWLMRFVIFKDGAEKQAEGVR